MARHRGFTLVELMIVITIIAILATIGMAVYSGIQKNARDAKRKADINQIANAMETNYGKTTASQYDALGAGMFSSGGIPQDPIDTSSSTTDNACQTVCEYCFREGAAAQSTTACANATAKITTVGPTGGPVNKYWVVCANLEASGFYCRGSTQ